MKKTISIMLSVLMVLSLAFTVYAGNANKENGKNKETKDKAASVEAVPEITPGDTLDSLAEQLKENHKDKAAKTMLLQKIKEVKKANKDNTIPVVANGKLVKFDIPPVIKQGRTLIPVRGISNALGATVGWDPLTPAIVTITKTTTGADGVESATVIVIDLDSGKITKDGVEITLDVPPQVISNRTFVPIRFLAEAFGMKASWDDDLDGVAVDDEDETETTPALDTTPVPETTATPEVTPTSETTAPEATPTPEITPAPEATPVPSETPAA